ncbi:MAG: hypothetical protein A2033_08815 [Bacteroidetes bacterium GWA2_31_9]|nr:MAG: hypothetical protein A2033_08815 [Bacteroidetes bacterium GWA2_31_9]
MQKKLEKIFKEYKKKGIDSETEAIIKNEIELLKTEKINPKLSFHNINNFYRISDLKVLQGISPKVQDLTLAVKTLEELIEKDKQREKDGFPRRIRIGKLMKPTKGGKAKVVVVPTTTEPKLYHDDSVTQEDEEGTGGAGEGEEGEVIGEQQAQPEQGEGEGQGAGQGGGTEHDISSEAFDIGRVLTEKFDLPNLKVKGNKPSLTKYVYDLTDINRGFGQLLDKKATLKRIIETNIMLGRIQPNSEFNPEDLISTPQDQVYRILSKEKDFESQAVVFFLRDYSGSMQGKPTEAVTTQHLLIYSWLMYQFQNNVITRFILHDTDAKEVPDFYTYYKSNAAGGTKVAPAFKLVNKIVEEENLAKDYNIYIFHGTDGDDWDSDGKELIEEIRKALVYTNRMGITVAKNSWAASSATTVEKSIENSGLLKEKPELIRIDGFGADNASEDRIIEGIRRLIS